MGHDVTVIGSANLDVVVLVPAIPAPGETVLARADPARHAGGKGLNQAVASARAGARTGFVGAVGDDPAADLLLHALREAGVAVDAVVRTPGRPSGTAHVTVRPDGENAIVVVAGANAGWSGLTVAAQAAVAAGTVLLAQLEVDPGAVLAAAALAREHGRLVLLNAAPAPSEGTDLTPLLDLVDLLVVNEHEATALAGVVDGAAAARALAGGRRSVVVTLGARGALLVDRTGAVTAVPATAVTAVDTTGAGDAFVGTLAAATALGEPLPLALRRACAAGALAVQGHGAVPSLPTRVAVDALLSRAD
ncbi:ribokinase [Jannaschia sp. R86511]|uniref:ribokinase n=1 Tax=Jannaschia sp. R86511 TaxID=3093853 RepID=UPI0036D39378